MSDINPGDVVTMKTFTWSTDNQFNAEFRFAKLSGGRKYAFLFLGAGSPEQPIDANMCLNALGWLFDPEAARKQFDERAAQAIEARRAATGTGAVGDESAVPKGCAQEGPLP